MIRQDIQIIMSASDLLLSAKTEEEKKKLVKEIKERVKKIDRQLESCRSDEDLTRL